jgi:hypothetical protein
MEQQTESGRKCLPKYTRNTEIVFLRLRALHSSPCNGSLSGELERLTRCPSPSPTQLVAHLGSGPPSRGAGVPQTSSQHDNTGNLYCVNGRNPRYVVYSIHAWTCWSLFHTLTDLVTALLPKSGITVSKKWSNPWSRSLKFWPGN